MKTAYNTHLAADICNKAFLESFFDNILPLDIFPLIYQYLNFTNDKNNISLVSKKWCIISVDNTKIITIFGAFYTDEGLSSISQRFKFLQKFKISDIWENLNPKNLLTSEELQRAYEFEEINQALRLYQINYGHPNPVTDEGISHFKNLTYLDLSFNSTVTDECIKNLTTLKNLELQNNGKISDEGLKNLTGLTYLNLLNNGIISNTGIMRLTNLIELDLFHNTRITNTVLTALINLTTLDLKDSIIGNYSQFKNLTNLKTLTLSEHIVDSDIFKLTNLCHLDMFSNENITDNGISTLTNLTYLDLSANFPKITEKGISTLTNLTYLDFGGNNDYTTIDRLSNLINLTHLDTGNVDVSAGTISRFKKLTYLVTTELTNQTVIQLTNLKTLISYGGFEITYHGIKFLTQLTSLKYFGVNLPLLTEKCIPYLTNLTYLGLDSYQGQEKTTLLNVFNINKSYKFKRYRNLLENKNIVEKYGIGS